MIADVLGSLINPQRTLVPLPLGQSCPSGSHSVPIRVNPELCGFLQAILHSPFHGVGGRPSGFDLADTEQIRPLAGMHRRDHRSKVVDLAITQLRRPAGNIVLDQSPGDLPDPPEAKINIPPVAVATTVP
jgi:hypothetical protein